MRHLKIINFLFGIIIAQSSVCQTILLKDTSLIHALHSKGYSKLNKKFLSFVAFSDERKLITNRDLIGKVTFVNFWSASCAPCLAEFEALNELSELESNNPNFQLLSFTSESDSVVQVLKHRYHINHPILRLSSDSLTELMFGLGFPTNLITDRNGHIYFIRCGGSLEKKLIKRDIQELFYARIKELLTDTAK